MVNSCSLRTQSLSVTPQGSVPHRGVTITPIHSSQPKPTIIGKALLKAVSKQESSIGSKNVRPAKHKHFNRKYLFTLEGFN